MSHLIKIYAVSKFSYFYLVVKELIQYTQVDLVKSRTEKKPHKSRRAALKLSSKWLERHSVAIVMI